jgi:hypothetical protein
VLWASRLLGAPTKALFTSGIKLFARNKGAFCDHMRQFVLHMTDQSHTHCRHQPRPPVASPRLHPVDNSEAVAALTTFIEGYLNDWQRYLHGFNTIQLESLNGSACKRVNKERNWTVMYAPLFDAGILERNDGAWFFAIFLICFPTTRPLH